MIDKMKKSDDYDHYGRIKEVIELNYNDKTSGRSVVLFKCYWYDQDPNKKRGPRNGGMTEIITTGSMCKSLRQGAPMM